MGPRRLYSRIYLHFVAVLVVVGIASSVIFATGFGTMIGRIRSAGRRLASHVAVQAAERWPDAPARDARLRHIADELDIDITLRDEHGRVLLAVGPVLPPLSEKERRDVTEGPPMLTAWRGQRYAVAPVIDPRTGQVRGFLEATLLHRFGVPGLLRPATVVMLVLLIVAVATVPLARRISRPVERLTEATRRFGAGELGYRLKIPEHSWGRHGRHRRGSPASQEASAACRDGHNAGFHGDELTQLARAWNEMAERIEGLVRGHKELLANISHELRSPLARIRVALELLPSDERTRARLDDVERDITELDRLIEDVLTTSRLEATGLPFSIERVDTRALLEGLVARLPPDAAGAPLRLADGPTVEIDGDGALLRRAVWNLVENATKYGAAPITLAVERRDDRVRLSVSDEGAGIAPADRARVLEPFYRADRARTPTTDGRSRGFGLGLTLARRVAEVHRGTLEIDASRREGEREVGCRVTLDLPLTSG